MKTFTPALAALALSLLASSSAWAGGACPPGLPPQVTCGGKDMADVTAGAYALDSSHAAVIAQVSHIGYSFSIFRFDDVKGSLTWNPADLAKSQMSVTVKTASIDTNVAGFADELAGARFLNSKAFPDATFVSTGFRRTDATHGQVDGQFTLLGKTQPVTFAVELVGAGKGFGHPRMGVHATTAIHPADYGMGQMYGDQIQLVIDVEFEKAA